MEDDAQRASQELASAQPIEVDCDTCVMRATDACGDCLVTYICDREPDEAVIITIEELRAMRTLSEAGLVPDLKHRRGAV